jgi:peptide/nickel transport system substrate-binding protein
MDRHNGFARQLPPMSRRQLLSSLGALGGAALAVPLLDACGGSSAPAATGGGTSSAKALNVTWTNVALPTNIDPAIGFDSDTLQVVRNVYEGLLEYAPGSTTVRPALAKSYSVSPDGTTYTFQLRPNVVFHDGAKLDADAVVTSLNRIREINQGPASLTSSIKSFTASGPSTVVVTLSEPYAFLPGVMPWLPIVSPDALKAHSTSGDPHAEKWFASNAVGTGPYKLGSFSPTTTITLTQNTKYWQPWADGTPTGGSLTLNANVATQLELLQSGQVDFLGAISPDNAVTARTLSNVALLVQPGFEVQILPMNMARAPMNNPKLREAIVKAFNYSAFKTFNKGFGQSANSPVPQGLPGWDASIPDPAQDMAAAKQLVAASGVAAGTTLDFIGVGGLDYEAFAGTILQSALGQLGLKLKVQTPQWPIPATMMSKPSTAAHITFLNLSANTNDPSVVIQESWSSANSSYKGGYNWSNYSNAQVDSDLASFGKTSDAAEQKTIITRMQQTIVADNTAVFAFAPQLTEPVAKKWRNSRYDALFDENVVRWFYTKAAD